MNSTISKTIQLLYFSSIAEVSQKSSETLATKTCSLSDLWLELQIKYDIPINTEHVRPSVNHRFCEWQDDFNEGDIISFIPPVSGG